MLLPFNIILEVLKKAIREEKEIKFVQVGREEVKPSVFTDNITLSVDNPKESTKKLSKLSSASLQDIKSIYKNQLYFYIPAMSNLKMKFLKLHL